jgi:hypothetical protein
MGFEDSKDRYPGSGEECRACLGHVICSVWPEYKECIGQQQQIRLEGQRNQL